MIDTMNPTQPLHNASDLRAIFEAACKPQKNFCIGIESERFGVHAATGQPLQYAGSDGIEGLFDEFRQRFGWQYHSEYPGGPTIALHRKGADITLEPGGQFEFSGTPWSSIHDLEAERQAFLREVQSITGPRGLLWIASGFHPLAKHDELSWVPKIRYGVMRVYLATRGHDALEMMRRTATVQANVDFSSIDDAVRKTRVALRLSVIVSAMFANAPLVEGKFYGGKSRRVLTWLNVDPDRQGLIESMWRRDSSLDDYIAWALKAPMFLIMRDSHAIHNTGQTFADYMRDGFDGHSATQGDWATHLNTLFPEVRLKQTIELRGADSVPSRYAPALPALWTGLLYDDIAFERAERLSYDWTYDGMMALRQDVARAGLDTRFKGKRLAHTAEQLFVISHDGLDRRSVVNDQGQTEAIYLEALGKLVSKGQCPADEVIARLSAKACTRENILAATEA